MAAGRTRLIWVYCDGEMKEYGCCEWGAYKTDGWREGGDEREREKGERGGEREKGEREGRERGGEREGRERGGRERGRRERREREGGEGGEGGERRGREKGEREGEGEKGERERRRQETVGERQGGADGRERRMKKASQHNENTCNNARPLYIVIHHYNVIDKITHSTLMNTETILRKFKCIHTNTHTQTPSTITIT